MEEEITVLPRDGLRVPQPGRGEAFYGYRRATKAELADKAGLAFEIPSKDLRTGIVTMIGFVSTGPVKVRKTLEVRRALARGDLIEVAEPAVPVPAHTEPTATPKRSRSSS